jgi:hypothetical protein
MLDQIKQISDSFSPYVWGQIIKSKKNYQLYEWLMQMTSTLPKDTSIRERVYIILNPTDPPFCEKGNKRRLCNKEQKYMFCGRIHKCECYKQHHKDTFVPPPPEVIQERKRKCVEVWQQKYGVSNPSKVKEVQQKRKDTYDKTSKENLWKRVSEEKTLTGYEEVVARVAVFVKPKFDISEYKGCGRKNRYLWECVSCSHQFKDHVDYGRFPKCRKCYPHLRSQAEREIREFIEAMGIKVYPNNRSVLKDLEYDMWIPSHNLAIEYNGVYWHSDKWKDPEYHVTKFVRSRDNGVRLIQIFEDEWKNKSQIIKRRLMAILGKSTKIYARNCKIVNVSPSDYKKFVEENHLQGYASASIKLGLTYEERLVAVMSFSTTRYTDEGYELIRYCSEGTVTGGASKLFKNFIKTYNPTKIVSYANRCWSNGGLYEQLGFKNTTQKDNNTGYWYIKKYTRYHRSTFTKKRLISLGFDSNKTESEIMDAQGFLKVYDAGNYSYEWNAP